MNKQKINNMIIFSEWKKKTQPSSKDKTLLAYLVKHHPLH